MSEISKIETQGTTVVTAAEAGLARRRLIRAGLAAAPVMMGLTSQSALATGSVNHCKPSVWSSLKAARGCHASAAINTGGGTCRHYSGWVTHSSTTCDKRFHYHSSQNHVPFGGTNCNQTSKPVPTLREVCRGTYSNTNYGSVKADTFAKHCAAMYLNIKVDNNCPIDQATVNSMWNSCKDGGSWTLPSGGTWSKTDCVEYFEYVCKGTKPLSWTWNNQCA